MVQRRDKHHLFLERGHPFQGRVQHRTVDKGGGQPAGQHSVDHGPGRSGGQVQFDLGVALVIGGQQLGNAYRRGTLQRTQRE
ncbi:hypothetical protein D3C80_2131510 [compost metagenome]